MFENVKNAGMFAPPRIKVKELEFNSFKIDLDNLYSKELGKLERSVRSLDLSFKDVGYSKRELYMYLSEEIKKLYKKRGFEV